jgi:hypothetical protein
MSAAKRTPGTWVTEGAFVYALNANGHNRFYAGISPGRDDDEARVHDEELFANARLIAAAPTITMQAAAFTYTVERFMRAGDGSDPRVPPTEAEVAEAMYALRAAIAKAEGRTE